MNQLKIMMTMINSDDDDDDDYLLNLLKMRITMIKADDEDDDDTEQLVHVLMWFYKNDDFIKLLFV